MQQAHTRACSRVLGATSRPEAHGVSGELCPSRVCSSSWRLSRDASTEQAPVSWCEPLCCPLLLPPPHAVLLFTLTVLLLLQVISLVESMLQMRLRFIPEPQAQERYLKGAVAEVLSQAHGRITRILQQADLFKNIMGQDWLYKVGQACCWKCCALRRLCVHSMAPAAAVYWQ